MSDGTYTGTTTIVPYDGMRVWMDGYEQVFLRDRFWVVNDLQSGRVRIGGPGDWFARITWAPHVWSAVHPILRPVWNIRSV